MLKKFLIKTEIIQNWEICKKKSLMQELSIIHFRYDISDMFYLSQFMFILFDNQNLLIIYGKHL